MAGSAQKGTMSPGAGVTGSEAAVGPSLWDHAHCAFLRSSNAAGRPGRDPGGSERAATTISQVAAAVLLALRNTLELRSPQEGPAATPQSQYCLFQLLRRLLGLVGEGCSVLSRGCPAGTRPPLPPG